MMGRLTGGARLCALTAFPLLILWTPRAEAAGFAVRENSGSMVGNAFAGVPTNTDDISSIANNPALLGAFDGINASAGISYINPNAEFKDGEASTVTSAPINTNSKFDGDDEAGRDAFVGATYLSLSLTDDIKTGLAVTTPFGLLTDNSAGWVGRYHALKSQLVTFDINPMVAFNLSDSLAIGGGFRAVYADTEISQAIDFGSIGEDSGIPGSDPTNQDGRAKLTGDDWGFGGNAGILFDAGKVFAPLQGLRLGAGYRSRISLEIDGDTDFDLDSAGIGQTLKTLSGQFEDSDATADVDLPESITFGAHYDINDQWAIMGQAEWTNWSEFEELRVDFDNSAQEDSVTEEDWDDSWFLAGGVTHRPTWLEGLTMRLGMAYETTPVPNKTRTPRVPDEDRLWIATGLSYQPASWISFDFGYTRVFLKDADIDLKASDEGNTFRGDLSGEYETHFDIFAIQANLRF